MAGRSRQPGSRGQETRRVPRDRHHKRRDVRVRAEFRVALGRFQLGPAFPVVHAHHARPDAEAAGHHAGLQDAGDGRRVVRNGQIVFLRAGRLRRKNGGLGR